MIRSLALIALAAFGSACGPSMPEGSTSIELLSGELRRVEGTREATLLAFWSTTCANCVREIPELAELHEHSERIEVVGVNIGDSERRIDAFLEKRDVPYPIARDPNHELARRYGVEAVPTRVLVDSSGETRFLDHALPEEPAELEQLLP